MEKMRVLSLFSGIGAFEKALSNIGVEYELVGFSEIDKYAIKSYCAIHNVSEELNLGDVSKIDKETISDFDILVGGSPCQAFSVAGNRKGFEDTRGTLVFQYIETLKIKQPKYFVYENVKGLVNHDKGQTFDIITQAFSEVGYRIDIKLMNSKYFNVPQHRERIYVIGIREDLIKNDEWEIDDKKKDVLTKGKRRLKGLNVKSFNFRYPEKSSVNKRLRDILEIEVDEKFYLSEEKTGKLVAQLNEKGLPSMSDPNSPEKAKGHDINRRVYHPDGLSTTITNGGKAGANIFAKIPLEIEPQMLGHVELKGHDAIKRVYSPDGVSPTLTTMGGGYREPKIAVGLADNINPPANGMNGSVYNSEGLKLAVEYSRKTGIGNELEVAHTLSASDWRGLNRNQVQNAILEEVRPILTPDREEKRQNGRRFKEDDEPSFTVNTIDRHGVAIGRYPTYRIRKLTPLECFRLQAFCDKDFYKAKEAGISNSQLYKQAGNSITVSVLEGIFKELLNTYETNK